MISIVKKYLEKNHYSDKKESFEELFLSHPNYPSVFAITDSFDILSIENAAVRVPKQQFIDLPDSFLAIFNRSLVLVAKNHSSVSIETEDKGKKNLTFNEFLTGWDEIVVIIEPSSRINVRSEMPKTQWILFVLPVMMLIAISLGYNNYSFYTIALLFISIAGLITSVFIVQEKLGFKNELVSKFCNINANTSCDSVIKSDKSDINKWVSFSDLPLLFFGINVLSVLLEPKHSGMIVGFLSLLAIPVILYSIWLQKFQLRKWCVLCLAVSFIVVLQSLVFGFTTTSFPNVLSIHFFVFLFSAALFASTWLLIKPVFITKIKAEKEVIESKKFKRNYQLFNFMSKEIPVIKGFSQMEGLHFGNKNAEVQLAIIISPSCGHCHKTFEDGYELVSKFPERVFLKVLFNVNPENNDNPYISVVETLLDINNAMPEKAIDAIADWHIRKMGLDEWKEKWTINVIDMKANHQIHQQYDWCLENKFNYTPVKIINGKLFPKEYEISELKYFLNDFSEEKKAENTILIQA